MKKVESKKVRRHCKKENKESEFYLYIYEDGSEYSKCADCAKAVRKARYKKDPTYDNNYTKGWNKRNPEKIKGYEENQKALAAFEKNKNVRVVKSHFQKHKHLVESFGFKLDKISNKILDSMIFNHSSNIDENVFVSNLTRLLFNKRKKLIYQKHTWWQSHIVKSRYGYSGQAGQKPYSECPEDIKIDIKNEYKERARKLVNAELEQYSALVQTN